MIKYSSLILLGILILLTSEIENQLTISSRKKNGKTIKERLENQIIKNNKKLRHESTMLKKNNNENNQSKLVYNNIKLLKNTTQDLNQKLYEDVITKTDEILEQFPQKQKEGIKKKVKDIVNDLNNGKPSQEAIKRIEPLPINNVAKEKIVTGIIQAVVFKKTQAGQKSREDKDLIPSSLQSSEQ